MEEELSPPAAAAKPSVSPGADLELRSSTLNEPFVGNITKCIPLPPDYTGPPKAGHLEFEACFEGGD